MSTQRKSLWKIPLIVFLIVGSVLAWLGFGENGLFSLYRKEKERQAYVERIRQLAEENQMLLEEVHRLRTDMGYIEEVAREELCLIKGNEVIYRFNKANGTAKPKDRAEQ